MSNKKDAAFIYADESGHSGKEIFNKKSPTYYQGAIFSVGDIEQKVAPIIQKYCSENGLERLHGYELGEERVSKLCSELLSVLDSMHWKFHYTIIQKSYIAPTKFVDLIFDSTDNPAVHPYWYNMELFRHTLCILIDDMMADGLDEEFWGYFLKNDLNGILKICSILLKKSTYIFDKRTKEVVTDGLSYAIKNPDIFTLIAAKGKSAYKTQTPNIIAFSSLVNDVNHFCKKNGVSVSELIHDQNDEFRGTMREFHRIFSGIDYDEDEFGGIPLYKEVDYNLGLFKLESSKKSYGLQVADLFLWLIQRNIKDKSLIETKNRILNNSNEFVISRSMSLAIVHARTYQLMHQELTPEMIKAGKIIGKKIKDNQLARMKI